MEIIAAFLIGLASGLVGAIATGGGLISLPGVIFLGASPAAAIATTRLSAASGSFASLYRYKTSKMIIWKYVPALVTVSVLAGLIGPRLLLLINEDILEPLIGVLLLSSLPLLLWHKNFGIKHKKKRKRSKAIGMMVLFFVMIYGTMFGAGGGIFLIYSLMYFFGMNVIESNATGTAMWLAGTLVALVTYIASGMVVFSIGIPLMIGSSIGGYFGAQIALTRGTAWVKSVLILVIVISSIKLILF